MDSHEERFLSFKSHSQHVSTLIHPSYDVYIPHCVVVPVLIAMLNATFVDLVMLSHYSSYRYATMASILCMSVLKLRNLTCWLLPASMAIGSVSTHSSAGTSADCFVYARMLNTVGSSKFGRNVSLDTICLRIRRISAWNSASGLTGLDR